MTTNRVTLMMNHSQDKLKHLEIILQADLTDTTSAAKTSIHIRKTTKTTNKLLETLCNTSIR